MYMSSFLIPYYYDFNKIKTVNATAFNLPTIASNVRLVIFADYDLRIENAEKFTYKMSQMCQKLSIAITDFVILNYTFYPKCLPELSNTFPNVKAMILHGIDIEKELGRVSDKKIEKFLLGNIKTLAVPTIEQLEADKILFLQYWNDIKKMIA